MGIVDQIKQQNSGGIVSQVQKQTASAPASVFTSGVGSLPGIKQLNQFGVGVGTEIGKAGIGLGQTFLKASQYLSNKVLGTDKNVYNPLISGMDTIKQNVYDKPFQAEKSTIPGKVGTLVGAAAPFVATTPAVTAGQEFLQGATKADKILGSTRAIPYLVEKFAQATPEALVSGGTEYAVSGGDKKKAIETGATAGVLSLLTHVGADAYRKLIPQDVKTNVMNSLGMRGKISLDSATGKKANDAVDAYTTISRMAPDIEVVDKNGITKPFDPTKADYIEMPQALQQTKNKIYEAYTNLASKAGDTGAKFSPDDFSSVIDDLKKYEGKGYNQAFSNKANQIIDALNRFGSPTKTGVEFSPTDFGEIQKLVESINTDVNPLSDKAGAKVAIEASSKIREILDDKITRATTIPGADDKTYQQLRTAYAQLKSVEGDVINNYKKALRQQGIAGDIIDGISTVDAIQGILTGEKNLTLRGALIQGTKKAVTYLRDPEVAMQRAFKLINEGGSAEGGLGARITGPVSETSSAFKAGQAAQEGVKDYAKNPSLGMSMRDISKMHPDDKAVLRDFTDYVSGGYKPRTTQIITDARRVAVRHGLITASKAKEIGDKALSSLITTSGLFR